MKKAFFIMIIIIVPCTLLLLSCASIFYKAAELGNVPRLKALLEKYKIDINKPDYKKDTALLIAIQENKKDAAEFLLKEGANPNYQRPDSYTPLRAAIENTNKEMVALLLRYKANVNTENINGWVPLMSAVRIGNLPIVKLLIDKGANIHATTLSGYTPSSIALKYEHFHIKDYLQEVKEKEEAHTTPTQKE